MYAILDHQLAEIIARAQAYGLIYDDDVTLLLDALRDTDDELGRLQKAMVGRCASCGREGVVVFRKVSALQIEAGKWHQDAKIAIIAPTKQ